MNFTVTLTQEKTRKCEYPAGITMTAPYCPNEAAYHVFASWEGGDKTMDHDYCKHHSHDVVSTLMARMGAGDIE